MTEEQKKAANEVFKELKKEAKENPRKFYKDLKKHENGEFAAMLREVGAFDYKKYELTPIAEQEVCNEMIKELNKDVTIKSMLEVLHSSKKMDWGTPDLLFKKLEKIYGPFDLDAAGSMENKKCAQYYSEADDSLKLSWNFYAPPILVYEGMPEPEPPPQVKTVFLNPPYGRSIGKWMKKAAEEAKKGCTVVCLVPSRTGSAWFQNAMKEASEVLFLKGRVVFETAPGQPVLDKKGKPMAAPFDSAIIVFKPDYHDNTVIKWWDWKNDN